MEGLSKLFGIRLHMKATWFPNEGSPEWIKHTKLMFYFGNIHNSMFLFVSSEMCQWSNLSSQETDDSVFR